ncbi:MAG: LysM peptidoglycan-binding domain-containing protein [Candidatus Saccharimonadales bacterium]
MRLLRAFITTNVFIFLLMAAPAHAIESFGVGALPANPRPDNPRTSSIFVHEIGPGESVQDAVRVINNTQEEKTLSVYAVDSELSSDGAFACAQAVEEKKSVGSWIKLAKQEVVLKPSTSETIDFTITAPKNASVGEHNGCIAVQDLKKNEATPNGIVLSFRSALRVAVTVPGDVRANLTLKELGIQQREKQLIASPVLHNDGNVSLDTDVKVRLRNVFGMQLAEAGGTFPILPGATSKFNLELERPFWGGWYQISGNVTYERLQSGQKKAGQAQTLGVPATWQFVVPHPVALAVEVGLAAASLLAASVLVLVKRRKRQLKLLSVSYAVKPGETLEQIAARYNIPWRRLAKLNQLKAPYTLRPNQILHVPHSETKQSGLKIRKN